jgi:DNA-binding HxlR family transcriptional regulator
MNDNSILCPVETTLSLIENKWKIMIIRDLLDGTKRFGELKKTVGNISQKVLTANLREMEATGLLLRKVYAEVPPRVEYTLTEVGYSLRTVLDSMVEWGNNYKKRNKNFLNIYTDNMTAYTRNRTQLIKDTKTLAVFITTLREECNVAIDTIEVDEINVNDTFFEELEEANELLVKENMKLVVDKRLLLKNDISKFSNISCKYNISEAN